MCLCEGDSLEAYKGCYGDHHGNKGDGDTHSTNDFQGQSYSRIISLKIEDIDAHHYYIISTLHGNTHHIVTSSIHALQGNCTSSF